MMDFTALVGEELREALKKQGVTEPTDIQAKAVPPIKEGRDVIAQSATGTGKTLAYLLPVFMGLEAGERHVQAVVLAPTYELAAQVFNQAKLLWDNLGLGEGGPALLIGGAGIARQVEALKAKPRLAVGTPGRVAELVKLKKLTLHYVRVVVLDEGDRLMSREHMEHVAGILKGAGRDRQTLMFSATLPEKAREAASAFMREPVFIGAQKGMEMPEGLSHQAVLCERRDKIKALRSLIHTEKIQSGLVFLKNGEDAEDVAGRLNYHGVKAAALSAKSDGAERKAAINSLRQGSAHVLCTTDAASRGLDIPGLTHVINLDVPQDKTSYLHRAGRTGRMGAKGTVVTLATEGEKVRLDGIAGQLGIEIAYGRY